LDAHRASHADLSGQVISIYRDFQANPAAIHAEDVRDFLNSWLIGHIKGDDFAYRDLCVGHAAAHAAHAVSFLGDADTPRLDWSDIRIMLVDDNPNFRKLVQTILKAIGVRHLELVDSCDKAAALLAKRPADVVLCDWVMEGMPGEEFVAYVDRMELPSRVIMLTGYSKAVLRERVRGLKVFDYVEKPVRARELLDTIARAALTVRLD
ncbi:MAG: response regulator, partial [Alphaproteobacteria bacterium]|nr:response regulator [Alphaproteobacteria bacterium]